MNSKFNRISVVGLGYIGLPTAATFASEKVKVIGLDVNPEIVEVINQGRIHIAEPDLDKTIQTVVKEGYLWATTEPERADAFLIAVPTPFKGENREPDLSFIEAASKAIAPVLSKDNLVILESTSPVGATEKMANWLSEERPDLTFPQTHGENSDIRIAHCPERVLPGKVMIELKSNDRIIGGMTRKCSRLAAELYKTFVTGNCVEASSTRVAEMAKLTENSYRDVNIAFANEVSILSDIFDVNTEELISLANLHPRVNILKPGIGVGGHCIPVDPWFLVHSAPKETNIIKTAREVNLNKTTYVIEKILYKLNTKKKNKYKSIIFFGASYKPDVDDFRESPAIEIINSIAKKLNRIQIYLVEPYANKLPKEIIAKNVELISEPKSIPQSSLQVHLVEHSTFVKIKRNNKAIDFLDFC